MMDMEKLLDQLVMFSPSSESHPFSTAAESLGNLANTSSYCMDKSHNSSSANSSNSSWLSESLCRCHSPRSADKINSSLVFYKRPILPPVLCASSRAEMVVYKMKAIEKERKHQQKNKSKLLSRVEAILSTIDINASSTVTPSQENLPRMQDYNEVEMVAKDSMSNSSLIEAVVDDGVTNTKLCEDYCQNIQKNTRLGKLATDPESIPIDYEEEKTFQDIAYRQSLKNLLQKTMTLDSSVNNSTCGEIQTKASHGLQASSTSTPSSSTINTWSDNTIATLVFKDDTAKKAERLPVTADAISMSLPNDKASSSKSDTSFTARELVDSLLVDVCNELEQYTPQRILIPGSDNTGNHRSVIPIEDNWPSLQVSSGNNDELDLNLASESKFHPLDNDEDNGGSADWQVSTSTTSSPCKATEHIDKALELIGNNLACNLPIHVACSDQSDASEKTQTILSKTNVKNCTESFSPYSLELKVSPSSSISLETNNLIISYQDALELQEVKSPEDSILDAVSSLHNISHLDIQADDLRFKDERQIAGSLTISHVNKKCGKPEFSQEIDTVLDRNHSETDNKTAKIVNVHKKHRREARVRRGSYSIEAPSPLLVNTRDTHTVYSLNDDDAIPSEANDSCIFNTDVKRKLEMPSDSEESSIISARSNSTLVQLKVNTKMSDYCKMLEEQHQIEMLELQRQHEMQLEKFKQDLLSGQSELISSYETCDVLRTDQLSPSSDVERSKSNEATHKKWCKFSALVKGYLTRRLLATRPVQTTMQTIKDTSRTILAVKSEDLLKKSSLASSQDATLLERLFLQLQSALYELHEIFFEYSIQEKMDVIAQSRALEHKTKLNENSACVKVHRLSTATLKSLERKKLIRQNKAKYYNESNKTKSVYSIRPLMAPGKIPPKEVKSKISSIWKVDSMKKPTKARCSNPTNEHYPKKHTAMKPKSENSYKHNQSRPLYNRQIMNSFTPTMR
ncbi:uncharacterized protein LOC143452472 isoform X2 [Clavelina lepadiformis]|uniref:uncharacterized protein LOC143452472 isoform X2 n=1 Tax=Clavelina lepadiformis TaxID=159417 RepID=UPI0040425607